MLTRLAQRCLVAFVILLATAVYSGARAQTPTPTPDGEFLCSAGPRDGQACNGDTDCAPTGVCVIAPGICNGGTSDGTYCDCSAGICTASTPAPTPACDPTLTGVCTGGANADQCCDLTTNCAGGVPCVGAQKVCLGGDSKAASCLNDGQCPGSVCQSTGKFCNGGDFDSLSCVDNLDCKNLDGTTGGVCTGVCTGDCNNSGVVTEDELILMVNIALGTTPLALCPIGDTDGSGDITIDEIISAVNNAVYGCGNARPTPTPTGEFLCSAGPHDGQACNVDGDCAPTGVCVTAQGICDGGSSDGGYCDCAAGSCAPSTPACSSTFAGVCIGGANDTQCCDTTMLVSGNCADGVACVGTQKVCLGGTSKGTSCLRDAQCPGSFCQSTGSFCNGGDSNGYACVDNADCTNADGTQVGMCEAVGDATLTPTPVQPIPTPTPVA